MCSYRILREEEALVDEYALEILYTALQSLRMADMDAEGLGTVAKTLKVAPFGAPEVCTEIS